jgi:formyl-CoA transferase
MTKDKFEAMDICNAYDISVGPILSMKEISEDEGLYATGTPVRVDHPERGGYISVGNPIKLSNCEVTVTRSLVLGEHTTEFLSEVLGYSGDDLVRFIESCAVGDVN